MHSCEVYFPHNSVKDGDRERRNVISQSHKIPWKWRQYLSLAS